MYSQLQFLFFFYRTQPWSDGGCESSFTWIEAVQLACEENCERSRDGEYQASKYRKITENISKRYSQ